MKLTRLLFSILIAFCLLLGALLSLPYVPTSLAQGGGISMSKTLDRPTNVVRVGEVLTFTIALTNNSAFTLTSVTLLDNYDQNILAFARAAPMQSFHNAGTGTITWTNVATPATIPPNQRITVTVVFTVEHPQPATVNQVRAQDIIHESGNLAVTAEASRTQESIGGAAPVLKFTSPPTAAPQAGLPVTFTHIITNDGAAIMTVLPLTDTYDPNFLQFNYAIPTPTITGPPGLLVWTDLTTHFGDIAPFDTVVVTTVFTAVTQVVSTTNRASTQGAIDEYNNDLTAGLAQVPILIVGDSSGGDTGSGDNDDRNDDTAPAPAPAPTATPVIIIAPTASVTISQQSAITDSGAPRFLPETGDRSSGGWSGVVFVLLLLVLVGYLFRIRVSGSH